MHLTPRIGRSFQPNLVNELAKLAQALVSTRKDPGNSQCLRLTSGGQGERVSGELREFLGGFESGLVADFHLIQKLVPEVGFYFGTESECGSIETLNAREIGNL